MSLIREFKPTILFLVKFLVFYFVLNLAYGFFINHYTPGPDPVTRWVTEQSSFILQVLGFESSYVDSEKHASISIYKGDQEILSVFEGCNGLNVIIIFVAFLLSYGHPSKQLFWFIPFGLLMIHLTNLLRIVLLYLVSIYRPDFMYFTHKYLFTAIIYIMVFILWYLWIDKWYVVKKK